MLTVATCLQSFSCANGPPTSPLDFTSGVEGGWARSVGILMPSPLDPSRDAGLTCACSRAYLLAFLGGCPVSIEGVSGFLRLLPSF